MTATVHQLHRRPGTATRGCLAREHHGRCPRPPAWSLLLACPDCGSTGSGPACGWHKTQAEEWGVPHLGCPTYAPLTGAIPLS